MGAESTALVTGDGQTSRFHTSTPSISRSRARATSAGFHCSHPSPISGKRPACSESLIRRYISGALAIRRALAPRSVACPAWHSATKRFSLTPARMSCPNSTLHGPGVCWLIHFIACCKTGALETGSATVRPTEAADVLVVGRLAPCADPPRANRRHRQ